MEWLILVVVVPLVLVPLVLLFGFAGCGLDAVGTLKPPLAKNLIAKAVFAGNENRIILTWIGDSNAAKYEVLRGLQGQTPLPINTPEITVTMFTDSPATKLEEGRTYNYQVRGIAFGNLKGAPSNEALVTTLPAAPFNLSALPFTTAHIKLNWEKASANAPLFRIERQALPGESTFTFRNETTQLTFEDGVNEGGTYAYRVLHIRKDGFDESIPKPQVLSPPSNEVVGKPLAFATAFDATPPQANLHNHCLIQRIAVKGTGSKIILTIAGSGSALTLDTIWISRVGAGNPWDPAADRKQIDVNVVLPAGTVARVLDPVDYPISAFPGPVDLLVAFDINPAAGQGNVRFVNLPGAVSYTLNYATNPGILRQAGVPDRVPAFQTVAGRHYLVEKIQVL